MAAELLETTGSEFTATLTVLELLQDVLAPKTV
jgi:hypothetical protein